MRKFFLDTIEKYYWIFFALLAAATAFLCFRCLGIRYIDSWDEARHGISAYEMMQSGNYLVNTYLGEPDYWNLKPPLSFYTVIAGFSIFGYNAVGLRFFSALAYLLACICTGLYARRFGKLASLLTMAFLTANYFPFKAHLVRAGDADSLYLLLFTLAMLAMLKIRENQRWLYVCGFLFSLAFLTKSFHALMIAAAGGLFLLLTGELKRMKPKTWLLFLLSALLPILLWGALRFSYDGLTFFTNMFQTDVAGRTAAGGTEGHGFPFTFYLTSIFWNFDYIYGWQSLCLLIGCGFFLVRHLSRKGGISDSDTDSRIDRSDILGIALWLLVPLLGFSAVSTKLMWYVYPCTVPLSLACGILFNQLITNKKTPALLAGVCILCMGLLNVRFTWLNYQDNVRGAHSNALQTFILEQFDRDCDLAGSRIYLDAYDPFLYLDTTSWEQNNRLLAMMAGDLSCQDGGTEGFLEDQNSCLLILSIPFYEEEPALKDCEILADNGQYLLLQKSSHAPSAPSGGR